MRVKENANVKSRVDLQNLITSVLLKQTDDFTLEDIIHETNLRLVGSPFYASDEMKSRCSDILNTFFLFDNVQCVGLGKYVLSLACSPVSAR